MATVVDRGAVHSRVDRPYTLPTRNNAGSPIAALTPAFGGELVQDSTNHLVWQAVGPTNTNWRRLNTDK